VAISILTIAVVTCAPHRASQGTHEPVVDGAAERAPSHPEASTTISAPENLDASIDRGLAFLARDRSDLSALVVLDYLQRKYSLTRGFAFEQTFRGGDDGLRHWGRFVGRAQARQEATLAPLSADPSVEEVVERALNCDVAPTPPTFFALLDRFAARGDYEATHAALAAKLARDNGCETSAAADALDNRLRERLRAIVERQPRDRRFEQLDVGYEALAMLEDFLGDRAEPASVFAKVAREQNEDGGWRPAPDQNSRPHPTVLAVWALLARAHPEAARVRFARN
jgi:hypothetical protein